MIEFRSYPSPLVLQIFRAREFADHVSYRTSPLSLLDANSFLDTPR
jgi:hypothetical protein